MSFDGDILRLGDQAPDLLHGEVRLQPFEGIVATRPHPEVRVPTLVPGPGADEEAERARHRRPRVQTASAGSGAASGRVRTPASPGSLGGTTMVSPAMVTVDTGWGVIAGQNTTWGDSAPGGSVSKNPG